MADYAQAFFHQDWNTWTVGYYDRHRAGRALSYSTHPNREDAERVAAEFNQKHGGRA